MFGLESWKERLRRNLEGKQDNQEETVKIGNTVLKPDPKRGSTLDEIGEHYGDEFGDVVGAARAVTDWFDQRFKPSYNTVKKEIGSAIKKYGKEKRSARQKIWDKHRSGLIK